MNLVRIGPTVINLDRVTCVRDYSIRDAAGQVTRPFYRIEFGNHDYVEIVSSGAELQQWFESVATVLSTSPVAPTTPAP